MALAKCLYIVMALLGYNVCAELTDQDLLSEVWYMLCYFLIDGDFNLIIWYSPRLIALCYTLYGEFNTATVWLSMIIMIKDRNNFPIWDKYYQNIQLFTRVFGYTNSTNTIRGCLLLVLTFTLTNYIRSYIFGVNCSLK